MQNCFSVKCYTEWTNSCSGNAGKNDLKYSRTFEHAVPINTLTNTAKSMFSTELWTGKLSPGWRAAIPAIKCSNDLTITWENFTPWRHEIKPVGHLCVPLCTSGPGAPVRIPVFLLSNVLCWFAPSTGLPSLGRRQPNYRSLSNKLRLRKTWVRIEVI